MRSTFWRDIPGYSGMYQISDLGEVRTWRYRKERRLKKPKLLTPFIRQSGKKSNRRYVKLVDDTGRGRDVAVINIVVDVWLGGKKQGHVAYHKNGDLSDNSFYNIGFITRCDLGKKTGANSKRIPVVKIDASGNHVEYYTSAREAGKLNFASYQTILDRCHGRVKDPFKLDGYTYAFER